MLYLVKIELNLFLLACASVKSGALKMPPEIPVGRFSLKEKNGGQLGRGRLALGEMHKWGGGGWSF